MEVILWILGVLLALIVLLCVTRVGVHAVFGETLLLVAKIGWFRIHILPEKEANKKKKEREKKAEDTAERAEKAAKKPQFPKPSFSDIRDAVSALWPPLKRALDHTRRGLRIAPLDLSVTLGGSEDPVSAARLYGELNAAVWTAMPVLERLLVIPSPHIHIGIDFTESKTKLEGEVGVTVRIGTLLAVGATIGFPALKWFLQYKKKRENQPPEPKSEPAAA